MKSWKSLKKILCVRLDNIGDVIMTMPAIKALKEAIPDRSLSLLVSCASAEAARAFKIADELIVYDAPWMKASKSVSNKRDFEMIEQIRSRNFDAGVIFTVFSQSPLPAALLMFWAGVPRCLAYCHENPYQIISDWIKDPDPEQGIRHEVKRHLDLVSATGAQLSSANMFLEIPMHVTDLVSRKLRTKGVKLNKPLIIVHPGATAASRMYPAQSFKKAVWALSGRGNQVVLTGSEAERELVQDISRGVTPSFIGELNFTELCALIKKANVILTNNSAPSHIASVVGTPVVTLYALTNPQHKPWLVPSRVLFHDVPCKYCFKSVCPQGHHKCLRMVPWEKVVKSVEELLQETQRKEFVYVHHWN